MANNQMSPRQKMINMMYLVLIAMLALNVSKDLLKAFVTFDESLKLTLNNSLRKNNSIYNSLDQAKSLDPLRAGPQWEKAQQIKAHTTITIAWLDSLTSELISKTEGISMAEADTIELRYVEAQDNVDVPTNLMIGPKDDASEGAARKLKLHLVEHYNALLKALGEQYGTGFEMSVDTAGTREEGVDLNWETANFYRTPLVATVALLAKYKNDVRNAEYEALERLYASISERDLPFDTVAAKVIAKNDYVILGDAHQAEVFVAAYSTTKDPGVELFLDENASPTVDRVSVTNGTGYIELPSDRTGLHKYRGMVKMLDPHGEMMEFPFEHEYLVARPMAAVSPTKMNVFYRGIENPIDVSVPGYANEHVRVSVSGGNTIRSVGNGSYVVQMLANSPVNVQVNISVLTEDGSTRSFGAKEFRAMRLPDPYARLGDITAEGKISKSKLCAQRGLKGEYAKDFPFELTCSMVEFDVMFVRGATVIQHKNSGEGFSDEVKALLCETRRGDKIYFEHIKARGKDGIRKLNPLSITVR